MLDFYACEWMFFIIIITFPLLLLSAPSLHHGLLPERILALMLPRPCSDACVCVCVKSVLCVCVCVFRHLWFETFAVGNSGRPLLSDCSLQSRCQWR